MDGGVNSFSDYDAAVQMGRVPGVTRVAGIGTRTIASAIAATTAAQGIVAPEDIWVGASAIYPWSFADVALEAISDNVNDTAGGSGAQTITIGGINAAYAVTAATNIPLNGTAGPVAIGSHAHINTGTIGVTVPTTPNQTNLGTITIREVGTGTVRAIIPPGQRSIQQSVYRVPDGFFLNIFNIEIELLRASGAATRGADFALYFRFANGVYGRPRQIQCTDRAPFTLMAETRIGIPSRADFAVSCVYSSANNITVGAAFEGHLYKN
jgi:hypothetical protein